MYGGAAPAAVRPGAPGSWSPSAGWSQRRQRLGRGRPRAPAPGGPAVRRVFRAAAVALLLLAPVACPATRATAAAAKESYVGLAADFVPSDNAYRVLSPGEKPFGDDRWVIEQSSATLTVDPGTGALSGATRLVWLISVAGQDANGNPV